MRKRLFVLLVLCGVVASLALAATASADGIRNNFVTKLTGEAEVPPGDADGIGRAKILLHQQRSQVCWFIRVRKITLPATAAHIHFAPAGVAGDIVVPLSAPDARGQARGCISADPVLIAAIAENPEQYYVNVHNADYPAGALRGQLG